MATERQIAANRRNAQKSTGPKTQAGKTWSSGNAFRHGLTSRRPVHEEWAQDIERVASHIAGSSHDPLVLEDARTAAEAIVQLVRVRRARVALIAQLSASPDLCNDLKLTTRARSLKALLKQLRSPEADQRAASNQIASKPLDRTAKAVQRLLPDLRIFDRYERRAAARRDRALAAVARADCK